MPAPAAETALRDHFRALSDPSSLRDDSRIEELQSKLSSSQDGVERLRLRLRQLLLNAVSPSTERYEEGFITHGKAWADESGVTARVFSGEGVSNEVLRRGGFPVGDGPRRSRSARQAPSSPVRARRSRVTAEDVRAAIPEGTFTIKCLQDSSGASPAVVRKVVSEEESAGRLRNEGKDPDRGPGRAPVLYRRV